MKAIVVGSFDPITVGHIDVIDRATKVFDTVVVVVMQNPSKVYGTSLSDRVVWVQASLAHSGLETVAVVSSSQALVDVYTQNSPCTVAKGIRSVLDFEYEKQQLAINSRLLEGFETVFFVAKPEFASVSSSVVRELVGLKKSIKGLVCQSVLRDIEKAYAKD